MINKVKNTRPWTYVTEELNSDEITAPFHEKELQKKEIWYRIVVLKR